jgi:hypothetical protein
MERGCPQGLGAQGGSLESPLSASGLWRPLSWRRDKAHFWSGLFLPEPQCPQLTNEETPHLGFHQLQQGRGQRPGCSVLGAGGS